MKNMRTAIIPEVAVPLLLILIGFTARVLPHPANFTPIAAIALFGGLYLPRRFAIALPIAAMLISDIFIGFYEWKIMLSVYGSFMLMGLIGLIIRHKKNLGSILGGTLLGSILFFLITNAAVWIFGTMYPHTSQGLMQSYLMGIPFFKNTLLGDLFYVFVFVGTFEALRFGLKRQFWAAQHNPAGTRSLFDTRDRQ